MPSRAPATWDEEEDDSTPPSSPPPPTSAVPRRKFDDEEDDVLDSWDAEADSEEEREKAKAAEAKARAEAAEKANKKSRSARIEEHREANRRRRLAEEDESSDESSEDEGEKRRVARLQEKEGDLKHAEDLFGNIGISSNRTAKPIVVADPGQAGAAIDLSAMALFKPTTLTQFTTLRETLAPLVSQNSKKPQYPGFSVELVKALCRDMSSEQIKKVASGLTTLSNEKLKEEKAADKGGKKSKAAKSKTTLNASRDAAVKVDTRNYEDDDMGLDE